MKCLIGTTVRVIFAVLIFSVLGSHQPAFAQTDTGSISGVVSDPSGAVVPGATVTLTNKATSQERTTVTDSSGVYSVPNIPPGEYALLVKKEGFVANRVSGIQVGLLQPVGQNVILQLGMETTVVSVSANVAQLQTESPEVGELRNTDNVVQLPSNGRNLLTLMTLAPTMAAGTSASGKAGDSNFYGTVTNQVAVAGMTDTSTLFLQDGVENVNLITVTANIIPSEESVQEMNTVMNGADARYAEPSVINIITKGGENKFHGTAYDFLQNDKLNSEPYNYTTLPRPAKAPERYNLFGGNLGAPILKNKLFGFFDFAGLRSGVGAPVDATVPTPAETQCIANTSETCNFTTPIYDPATYNPTTGTTSSFPNSAGVYSIPSNRIDPFATKWMTLYPSSTGSGAYNYVTNITAVTDYNEYMGRGDWNISSKDRLYGSGLHLNAHDATPTFITGLFGAAHTNVGTNVALEETHVFSSRLVNTARLGYNRTNYFFTQQGAGTKDFASYYGLIGVSAIPIQSGPPTLGITNISSYQNGNANAQIGSPYTPQGAIVNRFQYADEVNMTFGKHVLYLGGEFVRTQYGGSWTVNNNGQYKFDGTFTKQYTGGAPVANTGNALADLLLGLPETASHSIGTAAAHFFSSSIAGYVQDGWRLTSKFTLNLGLRYEVFTPPDVKSSSPIKATSFNFATAMNQPGGWKTNYGDLGPRFGFAYSVRPHTVVRGGYGIYYAENPYNNEQFMLLYPPNFLGQSITQSLTTTTAFGATSTTPPSFVPVTIENFFNCPTYCTAPTTGTRSYTNNPNEFKDTSFQEWNLTVEQQLSNNTTLTVAYIGDVTHHQTVRYDGNQPDAMGPGSAIYNLFPYASSLGDQSIMVQGNITNSHYNGLMLSLNRHFSNGLQLLASYTWSRAFGINTGDNDIVENIYNLRDQYGPSAFDQPQVFNLSGVYDLPLGHGKRYLSSGALARALGDWRLSGIWSLAKATPTSIETEADHFDLSGIATPYATKVCNAYQNVPAGMQFNTSCFVQPATGQYGVGGQNELTGPHINNANISFSRIVRIKESSQLQIRADFLNAFNHPQLQLGGIQTVGAANYGAIQGAAPQRVVQVSLRLSF